MSEMICPLLRAAVLTAPVGAKVDPFTACECMGSDCAWWVPEENACADVVAAREVLRARVPRLRRVLPARAKESQ